MTFYSLQVKKKQSVKIKSWQRLIATLTHGQWTQKLIRSLRKTRWHYLVKLSISVYSDQISTSSQSVQRNYFIYVQEICKLMLIVIFSSLQEKKRCKNFKKKDKNYVTFIQWNQGHHLASALGHHSHCQHIYIENSSTFKIMVSTCTSFKQNCLQVMSPHSSVIRDIILHNLQD